MISNLQRQAEKYLPKNSLIKVTYKIAREEKKEENYSQVTKFYANSHRSEQATMS